MDQDDRTKRYQVRLDELGKSVTWELEGRLAVNNGEDGGSGNFNWSRQADSNRMAFHGALGRGAWRLESGQDGAVLEMSDGNVYRASTVSELIRNQFGWRVPIEALEWWVRGLEAPGGTEKLELDEQGLPQKLSQFGWDIEFDRYNDSEIMAMPFKMIARHENQTVKLAVKRWSLGKEADVEQ
jgi:outer membrane lipoprotein LolB